MRAQRPLHRTIEALGAVARAHEQPRHAHVLAGEKSAALSVERRDGALEAAAQVASVACSHQGRVERRRAREPRYDDIAPRPERCGVGGEGGAHGVGPRIALHAPRKRG